MKYLSLLFVLTLFACDTALDSIVDTLPDTDDSFTLAGSLYEGQSTSTGGTGTSAGTGNNGEVQFKNKTTAYYLQTDSDEGGLYTYTLEGNTVYMTSEEGASPVFFFNSTKDTLTENSPQKYKYVLVYSLNKKLLK